MIRTSTDRKHNRNNTTNTIKLKRYAARWQYAQGRKERPDKVSRYKLNINCDYYTRYIGKFRKSMGARLWEIVFAGYTFNQLKVSPNKGHFTGIYLILYALLPPSL